MTLDVKPGDRVARIMMAQKPWRAIVQHGVVESVSRLEITCKILTDSWRIAKFDLCGAGNLDDMIVKVDDLRWLFNEDTYYPEVT